MKNQWIGWAILALTVLVNQAGFAQIVKVDSTSNWKKSLRVGLNISQASVSTNWKAGGVSSFGFNSLFNFKANYKKEKVSWDNEIDLLYGMVNNQGQGPRKIQDRVFLIPSTATPLAPNGMLLLLLTFRHNLAEDISMSRM